MLNSDVRTTTPSQILNRLRRRMLETGNLELNTRGPSEHQDVLVTNNICRSQSYQSESELIPVYPCPYTKNQLQEFDFTHLHLACCPATIPPWNWRYRTYCNQCSTPCGNKLKEKINDGYDMSGTGNTNMPSICQ